MMHCMQQLLPYKALHLTTIPLQFMATGELDR